MIVIHDDLIERWKDKQNELFDLLAAKGNKYQKLNMQIQTLMITLKESSNVNDMKEINSKIKALSEGRLKIKDEVSYLTGATEYLRNILHDINENNKGDRR
jgi:predicted secreted protein